MQHGTFFLLLLSFVALCFSQSNTCLLGFSAPAPMSDMSACCWYEESTCCDAATVEGVYDLQNEMYDVFMEYYGANDHDALKCMTYLQNFFCFLCDPVVYLTIDLQGASITLCNDFCDGFYDACSVLPEFSSDLSAYDITDGTSLCMSLADFDPVSENKTLTGYSKAFSTIQKVINEDDDPAFSVIVTSSNCFLGADSDTVGTAECTPWGGDYTPSETESSAESSAESSDESSNIKSSGYGSSINNSPGENSPGANSPDGDGDGDGDGDDDSGFSLLWLIAIIGGAGLVCCIVLVGALVALFLVKRRSAYAATADSNYPQLDELED